MNKKKMQMGGIGCTDIRTHNIVVPKYRANAVKEMLCDITGIWPFSVDNGGGEIYIQTEMTDEEVAKADHCLNMIL